MVDSNPSVSSLSALQGELGGEDAEEEGYPCDGGCWRKEWTVMIDGDGGEGGFLSL